MLITERLKGIEVFVTVVESRSFTSAAEKLNLTVSAVSKGVTRLEERLGIQLFDRAARVVVLTEKGRDFFQTCKSVLEDLECAEGALHTESTEPSGQVIIDLPASYGRLHALPAMFDIFRRFPQLRPHVTLSDGFVDPVALGIDIFLRVGGPDIWPAEVNRHFLGRQRLVFCAAPSYLEKVGRPRGVTDLEKMDFVGYARGRTTYPLHLPQCGSDVRSIDGSIAIGDSEGQALAAAAGFGVAQLPTWAIERLIRSGELEIVLPDLTVDGLPINLGWLRVREAYPKVRVLLDFMIEALALKS